MDLVCKTNDVSKKFVQSHPEYILTFIDKDNEGILLKEKISEELKAPERESQENKPTEDDKNETINRWEVRECLDDGETCHVSKKTATDKGIHFLLTVVICQELIDQSLPTRISRRSKSPESFLTVEDFDAFLSRFKRLLWDRIS